MTLALARRPRMQTDPAYRWKVTRRAMQLYIGQIADTPQAGNFARWDFVTELGHLQLPSDGTRECTMADFDALMDDIRQRAIDEFRDGTNCESGTNAFLEAFDLGEIGESDLPIETKYVTVTVTVRLQVENRADEDSTYDDVSRYLSVDVGGNVDDMEVTDVNTDNIHVSTCCHDC